MNYKSPDWRAQCEHELIFSNENLPFKLFPFEGKDGNYRRSGHWHRSVEIFLVQEGELLFYIGQAPIPLSAGEFVLVGSNEVHSIEALCPNRTVVLQIPAECFRPYLNEGEYASFSQGNREDGVELVHRLSALYEVYQKQEYAGALKMQELFYALLYLLVTRFMQKNPDPGTIRQMRHLDRLSEVTSYLKGHYQEMLSLEMVAARFGFSPEYLSRMFRRYVQVNYKTYLLNLRTEYAVREMMHTRHSLQEIAAHNGFPDSRAFSKAFRSRYGCLPSAYRRENEIH